MANQIKQCDQILNDSYGGIQAGLDKQGDSRSSQDVKRTLFSKFESRFPAEIKKIKMNTFHSNVRQHKQKSERDLIKQHDSSKHDTLTYKVTGVVEKKICQPAVENRPGQDSKESLESLALDKCTNYTKWENIPKEGHNLQLNSLDLVIQDTYTLPKSQFVQAVENLTSSNQESNVNISSMTTAPSHCFTQKSVLQQNEEVTVEPVYTSTPIHHRNYLHHDAKDEFGKDIVVELVQTDKQGTKTLSYREPFLKTIENDGGCKDKQSSSVRVKYSQPVTNRQICEQNMILNNNKEHRDNPCFSKSENDLGEPNYAELRDRVLTPRYRSTDKSISEADFVHSEVFSMSKPVYNQSCVTSSSQFFFPVCSSKLQSKHEIISLSQPHHTNNLSIEPSKKTMWQQQVDLQDKMIDTNFSDRVIQDGATQVVMNVDTEKLIENIDLFKLLFTRIQVDNTQSHVSIGNPNVTEIPRVLNKNIQTFKVQSVRNETTQRPNNIVEGNIPLLGTSLDTNLRNKSSVHQTSEPLLRDQKGTSYLRKLLTYQDKFPDNLHLTSIDKSLGRNISQNGASCSSKSHELSNYPKRPGNFQRYETDVLHVPFQGEYTGHRLNEYKDEFAQYSTLDKHEIYIDLCHEEETEEDNNIPSTSMEESKNYSRILYPEYDYNYIILPDADDLVSSINITDDNRAVLSSTNDSEEMMEFENVIRKNLSSLDASFSGDTETMFFGTLDDKGNSSTNTACTSDEMSDEYRRKQQEGTDTVHNTRIGSMSGNAHRNSARNKRLRRKRYHPFRRQRVGIQESEYNGTASSKLRQSYDKYLSDNLHSGLEIASCRNVFGQTRNSHPRKAKEKKVAYLLRQKRIQNEHFPCDTCKVCTGIGPKSKSVVKNLKDEQYKQLAENYYNCDGSNYDLKKMKYRNTETLSEENENRFSAVGLGSSFPKPLNGTRQQIRHIGEALKKSKQVKESDVKSLEGKIKMPFKKMKKRNYFDREDGLNKLILYRYNTKIEPTTTRGMKDDKNIQKTVGHVANISTKEHSTAFEGKTYQSRAVRTHKALSAKDPKHLCKMMMCLVCRKNYSVPYIYAHRKRCARQASKVDHNNNTNKYCVKKCPKVESTRTSILREKTSPQNERQTTEGVSPDDEAARSLREHFRRTQPYWTIHKCPKCNYMTGSSRWLAKHSRTHLRKSSVTCKQCKVSFSTKHSMEQWHKKYKIDHDPLLGKRRGRKKAKMVNKDPKDSSKDMEEDVCSFMKDIKSLNRVDCQAVVSKISDKVGSKILLTGRESSVVYERQESGEFKKTQQLPDMHDVEPTDLCKVNQVNFQSKCLEYVDTSYRESKEITCNSFNKLKPTLNTIKQVHHSEEHCKQNELNQTLNKVAIVPYIDDSGSSTLSGKEGISDTETDSMVDNVPTSEESNVSKTAFETSLGNSSQSSEYEECMDGTERRTTRSNSMSTKQDKNMDTLQTKTVTSTSTGQFGGNHGDDEDDDDNKDENNNRGNEASIRDVEFFSCLVCSTSFSKKEDLMRHLTKIHRLTNLCTLCYFKRLEIQRFSNAVSLRNHKLRDHTEDMVECVCGSFFIDEKMLSSHLKKFKCYSRTSLAPEANMVKCVCGKRFENNELMMYHLKNKCRKRSFDTNLSEYVQKKDTLDKYAYDVCGKPTSKEIPKRPKCETVSYADSLLGSSTDRVELTNDNISDKITKAKVFSDTSFVCNENFKKTVEPDSVTLKQSAEDMNNIVNKDGFDYDVDVNMNKIEVNKPNYMSKDKINDNKIEYSSYVKKVSETNASGFPVGRDKTTKNTKSSPKSTTTNLKASPNSTSTNKKASLKSPTAALESSKSVKKVDHKKTKKGRKASRPDSEGRFPCKTCGRRFKRPYLYVHQKQVHQPRQWMWVPKLDPTLKRYKCGICNLVSIYWRTMVHHHYKKHPDMEFNVFPILPGFSTESTSVKS